MKRLILVLTILAAIIIIPIFIFNPYESVGIIGGSDGPTAIFVNKK